MFSLGQQHADTVGRPGLFGARSASWVACRNAKCVLPYLNKFYIRFWRRQALEYCSIVLEKLSCNPKKNIWRLHEPWMSKSKDFSSVLCNTHCQNSHDSFLGPWLLAPEGAKIYVYPQQQLQTNKVWNRSNLWPRLEGVKKSKQIYRPANDPGLLMIPKFCCKWSRDWNWFHRKKLRMEWTPWKVYGWIRKGKTRLKFRLEVWAQLSECFLYVTKKPLLGTDLVAKHTIGKLWLLQDY